MTDYKKIKNNIIKMIENEEDLLSDHYDTSQPLIIEHVNQFVNIYIPQGCNSFTINLNFSEE